jgi:hypothetical protein
MTQRILMKSVSSPARLADRTVVRGGVVWGIVFLLAAALFSTGCHKAEDATVVSPRAPNINQDGQATAPAAVPVDTQTHVPVPGPIPVSPETPALVRASGEPDLQALDSALMRWVFANQRRPNSFAEFAATAGQVIPPAPPGKKYMISQAMHVTLVNQ